MSVIFFVFFSLVKAASFYNSSLPSLVIVSPPLPVSSFSSTLPCTFRTFPPNTANQQGDSFLFAATLKRQGRSDVSKVGYFLTLETPASILDLPAHTTWVLRGGASDPSLMRDSLAFEIARRTGEYAPRARFVELYFGNNFRGVYVLEEKVDVGAERVAIKATDYLLKIDSDNFVFNLSETHSPIEIENNESNNNNKSYVKEIAFVVNDFETCLLSSNDSAMHKESFDKYSERVNYTNWINYFILTEFARSSESYFQDVYFYVIFSNDEDAQLTGMKNISRVNLGPGWDYNIAFGNSYLLSSPDSFPFLQVEGWQYEALVHDEKASVKGVASWYYRVLADASFQRGVKQRWTELRKGEEGEGLLSNKQLRALIRTFQTQLNQSSLRFGEQSLNTSQWLWEVQALETWLLQRAQWLDTFLLLSSSPVSEEDGIVLPHENVFGVGSLCSLSGKCGEGTVESFDADCLNSPVLSSACTIALANISKNNSTFRCAHLKALAYIYPECPFPLRCSRVTSIFRECRVPLQITTPPSFSPSTASSPKAPSAFSPSYSFAPSSNAPSVIEGPTFSSANVAVVNEEDKNNTAAVVGAIAGIFLVLALSYLCVRRRQKQKPIRPDSFSYDLVSMHSMDSYNLRHLDEPMLASFDNTSESMTPVR